MDAATAATIVGNLAIALSLVVALVFGIAQTRSAARDRKERLTIETVRSFQTREFSAQFLRVSRRAPPPTAAEFAKLPEQEQIDHVHFSYQMELIGLLVHDGTLDVGLVEKTLGDFVVNAWERYAPVLRDMRVANEDPYLGEYFEWLATRMEALMREKPRAPAYA
jgi:hypothetical protein